MGTLPAQRVESQALEILQEFTIVCRGVAKELIQRAPLNPWSNNDINPLDCANKVLYGEFALVERIAIYRSSVAMLARIALNSILHTCHPTTTHHSIISDI
jgi:hypothetical protein